MNKEVRDKKGDGKKMKHEVNMCLLMYSMLDIIY